MGKIKIVQEENEFLKTENAEIRARLLQVERETRKTHIVATGIEFTSPRDGFEQLEKTIKMAVGKQIKITGIRIFSSHNGKKIVASCGSVEEKKLIMSNKKLMRNCIGDTSRPVYLDDDLPKEDRELHSRARELARKLREEGKKARATRSRVMIDDLWFFLSPKTNKLEPCTHPHPGTEKDSKGEQASRNPNWK